MYLHRVFAIKLISEAHLKYFQRKSNQISKCYLVGCELKFVSTVDLYQCQQPLFLWVVFSVQFGLINRIFFCQAVDNVNSIIGPAIIGKVCISVLKSDDFINAIPKTHYSQLTGELWFRTPRSRLTLTTSWSSSLTEPPTNGAGVNKRYHGVDTYVRKLNLHFALFVLISFDVTSNLQSLEQMLFLPCHQLCVKLEPW